MIQAVPARVAIAGGLKCETVKEYLQMTRNVMDAGAAGVTYGRFVFRYRDITALVKTLSQVIHNGISVQEGLELLEYLEREHQKGWGTMYLNIDSGKLRDVVAFGRATIDLYANEIGPMEDAVTFHKYVGGSPANTAVAMSRLGLSVGYIGKVSDDQFGRFITRYLAKQGVDVSHIALAGPGIRSGVTMGEILPDRCSYLMYRTNCADLHIDCAQLDESYLASHKLLLISGTSLSHSPGTGGSVSRHLFGTAQSCGSSL